MTPETLGGQLWDLPAGADAGRTGLTLHAPETELDFRLSRERADRPDEPSSGASRDSCRLMHLPAPSGRSAAICVFSDLPELLAPGRHARLQRLPGAAGARCRRTSLPGAAWSCCFCARRAAEQRASAADGELWEVLARPSHRLRPGGELLLPGGEQADAARVCWARAAGWWKVLRGRSLVAIMEAHGRLPLPPYIKTYPDEPSSYQTVYAVGPGLGGRAHGRSAFHPGAPGAPRQARGRGRPT